MFALKAQIKDKLACKGLTNNRKIDAKIPNMPFIPAVVRANSTRSSDGFKKKFCCIIYCSKIDDFNLVQEKEFVRRQSFVIKKVTEISAGGTEN